MKNTQKKSSLTIFAMIAATLLSKALGMVRTMMTAWILGDSTEAVAFAAASKIPSAVFDFLFSAAILGCFIPMYNSARERSKKDSDEYASAFITAVMAACALLALIGIIFARAIISAAAPKISAEATSVAVKLLRIMFPAMIFTAGAYTLTGILQSVGNFILPAMISAVSNIFMIAYLVIFKDSFSIYIFALVFTLSWILQFLTLAFPLIAKKEMPKINFHFKNESLISSAKRIPNIMASSWLIPACILIASFFSSFVSETAFVAYDYSNNVYSIISGVAVYGVGNFVFPSLSRFSARNDASSFTRAARKAISSIMFIILPVFAATLALAGDGIEFLYLRGNFTEELAQLCSSSLRFLSFAMPACAVSEILGRMFYAAGKTKQPMYATVSAIIAAIISDILLVLVFKVGLIGISLSFAIAQTTQTAVLLVAAKKHFPEVFRGISPAGIANAVLSFAISLLVMIILERKFPIFEVMGKSAAIFLKIAIVFMSGVVVYLLYIFVSNFLKRKIFTEKGEK